MENIRKFEANYYYIIIILIIILGSFYSFNYTLIIAINFLYTQI